MRCETTTPCREGYCCAKHRAKQKRLKDGSVPEKVIQKQILDWLKETHLVHWRQNSGTVFLGNRVVRLGEDGLPDIVVVVPPGGLFMGLEVKSAKGSLRPAQKRFRDAVEAAGGRYRVVRTLAQAMDAVAQALGEEQWKLVSERYASGTLTLLT